MWPEDEGQSDETEGETRARCRWEGETPKKEENGPWSFAPNYSWAVVTVYPMRPNSRIYFGHEALVQLSSDSSIQRFAARGLPLWYGTLAHTFGLSLSTLSLFFSSFVKSTYGELGCFSGQSRDLSNIPGPNGTWREWYTSCVTYMYIVLAFAEICLLIIECRYREKCV